MINKRVKISSIVETQLPLFIQEEYPLISEFLSQYYKSLDDQNSTYDILQNIDQYVKLDYITNLTESTSLTFNLDLISTQINVTSTDGFPENNGLIKINNEIIYYRAKNSTTFLDCVRGFSGITSYKKSNNPEELVFSESTVESHDNNSTVENLSILLLKEFFVKLKKQILPGFENRELYSDSNKLNEKNFISHAKDFYSSKGTDASFEILFKALYGDVATIIKPRDLLLKASDSDYKITKDIVVESIIGDPKLLYNRTLFQKQTQGLKETFASVTKVEQIVRNRKYYYVLSLDYDYDKDINVRGSIFGDFSVHAKTRATDYIKSGSGSIIVDSTIGFPDSGELLVKSSSGNDLIITYSSKNTNQFLDCIISEDINIGEEICLNVYAYSFIDEQEVKVRILGVIRDLNIPIQNKYHEKNEIISFDSLGRSYDDFKYNNWILDVPNKYDVDYFEPFGADQIKIYTYDQTLINPSDQIYVQFFDIATQTLKEEIFTVDQISQDRKALYLTNSYNIQKIYYVRKKIKTYNDIINNVQNIYGDFSNNLYVTTQGIPDYIDQNIEERNFSIPIFGILQPIDESKSGISTQVNNSDYTIKSNQIHDFIDGDAVVYIQNVSTYQLNDGRTINLNIYSGLNENEIYYTQKVSTNEIRLFKSRKNISSLSYTPISYNRLYSSTDLTEALYTDTQKQNLLSENYFLQSDTFVILFDDSGHTEIWHYTYSLNQWEKINAEVSGKLYPKKYINQSGQIKTIKNNNLIKKISDPKTPIEVEDTKPGPIGILANGVEILNYKSNDFIYYGPIEEIQVISGGEGYDIVNLPTLDISSGISTQDIAVAYPEVTGKLERIDILDGGFDFLEEPKVKITGGNGSGAEAKSNLISFKHEIEFIPSASFVNLSNNTISFSTYHKFRNNEEIIYETNGNESIGGLSTSASYFISVQNDTTIKLHTTEKNSLSGIAITFTSYGTGTQKIVSKQQKFKISSITILNSGSGYKNNYVEISSSGINTYKNLIYAKNHGYQTGDIVVYNCTGTYPVGLASTSYYIGTIDQDQYRLYPVGIGSTNKDFYFKTDQYLTLVTSGVGTHIFRHEPISVQIEGITGISSFSKNLLSAKIRPIFRGSITNVYVKNGGIGYGSSNILNYDKQPNFDIQTGKNAQLQANILNGVIKEVYIISGGSYYNSVPDLIVNGTGTGCILSAEVENGSIKKVTVINGGYGYEQKNTTIQVVTYGKNAVFNTKIKKWQINYASRILNSNNLTSPDDGVLYFDGDLKYGHIYCPYNLRKKVYSKFLDNNGNAIVRSDYENSISNIKYHSPIIGWAYDGNPIYGPYGYQNPMVAGTVKKLLSGYQPKILEYRPPEKIENKVIFPLGSFVEDYVYTGIGDLDEFNGRYCVTPEYPDGTYAYFMTVSADDFVPQFPYFIGQKYKSTIIEDNFNENITQNNFDFIKNELIRNTYYYSINEQNSQYQFLNNPNNFINQNSKIVSTRYSTVDSVGVITAGEGYKVGDPINFYSTDENGFDASAIVRSIEGKQIIEVKNDSYSISDVELFAAGQSNGLGNVIAISTLPHKLNDFDLVSVVSNDNITASNKVALYARIGISSNSLSLASDIGNYAQTGLVTYFEVFGNLYSPAIIENDFYKIKNETIKILGVYPDESKIKVLRDPSGVACTATTQLTELTKKFTFYTNNKFVGENRNKQFYFNPIESVGFGTTSGSKVQVNYTGIGTTSLFIPAGNYYIPNHNLDTNTKLKYSSNGGNSIRVSNGSSIFDLSSISSIYAIKISNDFIGISTNKVSIGINANYVGVGTTSTFLYLTNYGSGVYHSFNTDYDDIIKARVEKNVTTVSTASTHGLQINDIIDVSVKSGITTTVKIKYSDINASILTNERYSSGIDTSNSIFTVNNHKYYTGQPIVYISNLPSNNIKNETIYYVNVIDKDRFKLSETYYKSISNQTINITISNSGYFYTIGSSIDVIENQKIVFDLSDSSLSFNDGLQKISAFDFDLYYDNNFNNKYYHDSVGELNVVKTGTIGITNNASLELTITDYTPRKLYYKLTPSSNSKLPEIKKQINSNSTEVLNIYSSEYSGVYSITGIGSTVIQYQTQYVPEQNYYNNSNAKLNYSTESKNAFGGIRSVNLISGGRYYTKLPGISSITTQYGKNAILQPISDSIGQIKATKILDIGYDYPIDYTLRPTISLPKVVKVEPFSSIEKITTIYPGKNYNYSPILVVYDPVTKQRVNDVILEYDYKTGIVTIIQNSSGFNDTIPLIIPIENSNGVGISTISYDPVLKRATAYLSNIYDNSNEFPVNINDKIFVENASIFESGSNYIGYNSSDYEYNYFTVVGLSTSANENSAYITYDMSEFLNESKILGTYNDISSKGSIVPQKNIPIFDVKIKKNSFLIGEQVEASQLTGYINNWDEATGYAKIQTSNKCKLGDLIVGKTSGSIGKITQFIDIEGNYNIDYYSIRNKGWQNTSGFLNYSSQRLHDNDYYQYFSYSVKSRIPLEKWNEPVDALNHTSGFKKFSDLSIESENITGISTDQNEGIFTGISDLNTVIDLECTYDFDLGLEENTYTLNSQLISDEITFNSTILQDHSQSIGNRVLVIDDISDEFNTNKKSTYVTAINI